MVQLVKIFPDLLATIMAEIFGVTMPRYDHAVLAAADVTSA